ncbi:MULTISPECIES: helix-turn-helix domain-containing protein [Streptomyces]|uniref:helix-turn-helix domain-containing protein n=1 Tax=Streptomyces sp. NPDC005386 TaxID=3154562 RepID=UPI0033B7561F
MLTQPSFGRRLRQLRQQRGMTQAELSGPGLSTAYISRLESGDRPPTERAAEHLAQSLDVSVSAFEAAEPVSLVDILATITIAPEDADAPGLRKVLQDALGQAASDGDPALRWQGHAHLARLFGEEGDWESERETLVTLNALSDELGHASLRLHSRHRLARCLRTLGKAELAREVVREGLELADRGRLTSPEVTRCRMLLASVTAELGDLAEAARQSAYVCENLPATTGPLAAEALWSGATIATRQGQHDRSAQLLRQAVEALDSRDDLILWMRLRLAAAALSLRGLPADMEHAADCLDQAKPAIELIGKPLHVQEYTFLRAQLAYADGDIDQAARLCAEVAEHSQITLAFRDRTRLTMLREQIRIKQGDSDAAARLQRLAVEAQSSGMLDLATEVWRAVAETRP